MSAVFTVEFIEEKGALVFVAGLSRLPLQLGMVFVAIAVEGQKAPSTTALHLELESIFVAGEPLDSLAADMTALLALRGDYQALVTLVKALKWQKKGGRFFRSSPEALILIKNDAT